MYTKRRNSEIEIQLVYCLSVGPINAPPTNASTPETERPSSYPRVPALIMEYQGGNDVPLLRIEPVMKRSPMLARQASLSDGFFSLDREIM